MSRHRSEPQELGFLCGKFLSRYDALVKQLLVFQNLIRSRGGDGNGLRGRICNTPVKEISKSNRIGGAHSLDLSCIGGKMHFGHFHAANSLCFGFGRAAADKSSDRASNNAAHNSSGNAALFLVTVLPPTVSIS